MIASVRDRLKKMYIFKNININTKPVVQEEKRPNLELIMGKAGHYFNPLSIDLE